MDTPSGCCIRPRWYIWQVVIVNVITGIKLQTTDELGPKSGHSPIVSGFKGLDETLSFSLWIKNHAD